MSTSMLTLHVEASEGRLDRYLAEHCAGLSRSQAQRLIAEGRVRVNGALVKASYAPVPGDVVQIELPESPPALPTPEAMPLRLIYEDDVLLVVDKPAGIVVHPGSGHATGTLVNALLAHRPDIVRADLDPERPGIVHRLDRDTSGLLVVAATRETQAALQAAFKARQVHKAYLALVYGRLAPERGAIEAPIGRDPVERTRMRVVKEGRASRTEYTVREVLPGCTLVEAIPVTGRTHQLRVHFSAIGHAIVGDTVYGPRRQTIVAPRHFLHAWKLSFRHPLTGEELRFTSELPDDLNDVLQRLRRQAR